MWARQAATAATALAVVAAVTGCGNSGGNGTASETVVSEGTDTSAGNTGSRVRACVLLDSEEIEMLTGAPITAGPTPNNGTGGCEWTAEVDDQGIQASHIVELQVGAASTPLDQALCIQGDRATIAGLGVEAIVETSSSRPTAVMAGYRDAQRVVTLRYEIQMVSGGPIDLQGKSAGVVDVLRAVQDRVSTPG